MSSDFLSVVRVFDHLTADQIRLRLNEIQKEDLRQGFEDTLLQMLMAKEPSFSVEDSTGILCGVSPFLTQMDEQVLSSQVLSDFQNCRLENIGVALPVGDALDAANSVHINQFAAELQVGGDNLNANCGPTSLVMALHQLGLRVEGETADTTTGEAVDLARKSMAGAWYEDGVDAAGRRVDGEHNVFSDFVDLARGVTAAGAVSRRIKPETDQIIQSLQNGATVIVSGRFGGKYPLPWTGDCGSDNKTAPGFADQHLVQVSSYDSSTGLFTINDPARNSAHQVTAAVLESFMAGNEGALEIQRG